MVSGDVAPKGEVAIHLGILEVGAVVCDGAGKDVAATGGAYRDLRVETHDAVILHDQQGRENLPVEGREAVEHLLLPFEEALHLALADETAVNQPRDVEGALRLSAKAVLTGIALARPQHPATADGTAAMQDMRPYAHVHPAADDDKPCHEGLSAVVHHGHLVGAPLRDQLTHEGRVKLDTVYLPENSESALPAIGHPASITKEGTRSFDDGAVAADGASADDMSVVVLCHFPSAKIVITSPRVSPKKTNNLGKAARQGGGPDARRAVS